jgi:hypothetical protein
MAYPLFQEVGIYEAETGMDVSERGGSDLYQGV